MARNISSKEKRTQKSEERWPKEQQLEGSRPSADPRVGTAQPDAECVPYVISWNLTQRCNLRCRHCYIDASTAMPDELSTEEALRVLDEIGEVCRETILILSGGEPLLRSDLDPLVEQASRLGMLVVLGTNGMMLTPARAHELAKRGLSGVGISMDSLLASRHDAFRGVAGAWRRTIQGIHCARRAGLEVQIQMTLTPHNFTELPQILRFARSVGVRVLTVFFLVCTGRGQALVNLTPEEQERALEWLVSVQQEGVMIRPRCAPTFRRLLAQRRPDSLLLKSDAGRCMAGKNYCRITPNGMVTPCPYLPLVAGSLREQSFETIWRSAPLFEVLRKPPLRGRCGACEYRELCGGCRARAFALNGDLLAEDPWCVYVPGTDKPLESRHEAAVVWTAEADSRIERVPFFVRRVVRSAVEALARKQGITTVTAEFLNKARSQMMRQR